MAARDKRRDMPDLTDVMDMLLCTGYQTPFVFRTSFDLRQVGAGPDDVGGSCSSLS